MKATLAKALPGGFIQVGRSTKSLDRADAVIAVLRQAQGRPVLVTELMTRARAYYDDVLQICATLEAAGLARRYEEQVGTKPYRVGYAWTGPGRRCQMRTSTDRKPADRSR